MAFSWLRLTIWLLVLCVPAQGFGIAMSRASGPGHFHLAETASSHDDVHDHDHDHDAGHHHPHSLIEHHQHDAGDSSVVIVEDDRGAATETTGTASQRVVADIETILPSPGAIAVAPAALREREAAPRRFDSHVGDPLERPPR